MLQPNRSVLSTVSPPESGFSPRPEFIRESHIASSFALFSIAGSGFVRLSSFHPEVVFALRSVFTTQYDLLTVREDVPHNHIEFGLAGKPWAPSQSKSVESEKLFMRILDTIFQHGYRFLSTIDYGRERSERVCITFSRPITPPAQDSARVPIALSFPSPKVLRVINTPLNSTPAILQAVRTAWPRGVVHEKMVSDKCYEFHLKGYSFFRENTFATDSLQCVLSLLNGLDKHAFTLLTSLSLSGSHSRVKDFWIFLGSHLDPNAASRGSTSYIDLPRGVSPTAAALTPPHSASHSVDTLHGRSGSAPESTQNVSFAPGHLRSATDPNLAQISRSSSLIRKKMQQRPMGSTSNRSSEEFPIRKQLSTIESMDMTGIGAGNHPNHPTARSRNVRRAPSPLDFSSTSLKRDNGPLTRERERERERVRTGDLFYETGHNSDHRPRASSQEITKHSQMERFSFPDSGSDSNASSGQHARYSEEPSEDMVRSVFKRRSNSEARTDSTPAILGSGVFRDSAFSGGTSKSYEIPISWTGAFDNEKGRDQDRIFRSLSERHRSSSSDFEGGVVNGELGDIHLPISRHASATTPKFPGSWPTPIKERPEEQSSLASLSPRKSREELFEKRAVNAERIASPMLSNTPEASRKSEVASFGTVPRNSQVVEIPSHRRRSMSTPTSPIRSEGWVLVNVAEDDGPPGSGSNERSSFDCYRLNSPPRPHPRSSLSPFVKAIAVEDARTGPNNHNSSGLKRFFSVSKSRSKRTSTASSKVGMNLPAEKVYGDGKLSLRDKWRKRVNQSL